MSQHAVTVGELITELSKYPKTTKIIYSEDPEGNAYYYVTELPFIRYLDKTEANEYRIQPLDDDEVLQMKASSMIKVLQIN